MSDRFAAAQGRKVLGGASAEELGNVSYLLVDTARRSVVAVVVDERRNARLVDWENVSGFGLDAVMIADEACLREPRDERERAASRGNLQLLGKRVLADDGNELGEIDDVIFNPESGSLEAIVMSGHEHPARSFRAAGSFAVILAAGSLGAHKR